MNAAQVRAKARKAMAKRAAEIEEEEGGEIDLVPYLDMVMNVMVFLLASVTAGYILGQINTNLPSSVSAEAVSDTEPDEDPDEASLDLVISVTGSQLIVWSTSGMVGTIEEPHAVIPRTNEDEDGVAPTYDYGSLNEVLYEVAAHRWAGEERDRDTYEVILQADGDIPYETIVRVMDNVRRRLPDEGFPAEADGAEGPDPLVIPEDGAEYDPDRHPLFPDIVFSMGFE